MENFENLSDSVFTTSSRDIRDYSEITQRDIETVKNNILVNQLKFKKHDLVRITKCSNKESIGFVGKLYTNLQCFHANASILNIDDILRIDKSETCIGIIGDDSVFLWTKHSDFYVEIEKL
jgi:hypothetical protein